MALDDPISHERMAALLRWGGSVGIILVAAIRCTSVIAPAVVFATDPVTDPTPMAALGPVGSLVLDILLLLACALALAGEAMRQHDLNWWTLGLAIAPLPIIILHGSENFSDLWRESTWMCGAVAAVTIAHLVRDRRLRLLLTALLMALLLPLIVRGIVQVTIEHGETLEYYQTHRAEVLAAQNIAPDSTAALNYERRLKQAEATGWFGFANVFGAVMLFSMIAWLGVTIAGVRARALSGWWGAGILITLLACAGVVLSGSVGVLVSAAIGVVLLLAPMFLPQLRQRLTPFAYWLPAMLIGITIGAVMIRGVVLPERFAGDASVLFRWHYLVGTSGVVADHPLLGTGVSGFQAAYTEHRLPISPEEISSSHNVFADWIAMLGILSCGWIAMLAILLRRMGRDVVMSHSPRLKPPRNSLPQTLSIAAVAVFGLGSSLLIEATSDMLYLLFRVVGILSFVGAAAVACHLLDRALVPAVRWSVSAAAISLLIHAQIETTFYHSGSVVWAWAVLGLAGGRRSMTRRRNAASGAVVIFLIALLATVFAFVPAFRQQLIMQNAEAPLRELGMQPTDAPLTQSQLKLEYDYRTLAVNTLKRAYHSYRSNPHPLEAAVKQQVAASFLAPDRPRQIHELDEALRQADVLARLFPGPRTWGILAEVGTLIGELLNDPEARDMAISARRAIVATDPHGVQPRVVLGDLLWEAGAFDEARIHYQAALEASDSWHLDSLRQLQRPEIDRLLERLHAVDPVEQ
ncbi:MAG: O-antigen ligase family protein [Phycisphaerales bacterium]